MTEEQERHRDLIREAARKQYGMELKDDEFVIDEYGQTKAVLTGWEVAREDEDIPVYDGETGKIEVSVVGSEANRNQRVAYYWQSDEMEEPSGEIIPFDHVQPLA